MRVREMRYSLEEEHHEGNVRDYDCQHRLKGSGRGSGHLLGVSLLDDSLMTVDAREGASNGISFPMTWRICNSGLVS